MKAAVFLQMTPCVGQVPGVSKVHNAVIFRVMQSKSWVRRHVPGYGVCIFNEVHIKDDEMSGTCSKHGDMKNVYNIVMRRCEGMNASGRLYT
jgi:hypothetical protein